MNSFNYFGYTSNLKQSLLEERLDGNKPLDVWNGKLNNYQFCFNHRQLNGQTRANIIPKDGMYVLGVVYVIDEKYLNVLFQTEPQYRLVDLDIQLIDSDNTIIKAKTFLTDSITSEHLIPSNDYLQTILTGAHELKLSEDYINYIISISNIKDNEIIS